MGLLRFIMDWKTKIGMWWFDYVHFPLWHRFGSKESKDEIKESLRKRREEGGCSSWRNYLKDHPEAAKYDWEKEFIK
mgnify:FL=1|jgi:hypothetical protein|tara:strand:+ start:223 stop:453 length:231 start_codon:yes stop_codon:yes gene_type:complete